MIQVRIVDSDILQNTANDIGGGIYGYDSQIELRLSTITGNTASRAGGVYITGSDTSNGVSLIALCILHVLIFCIFANLLFDYSHPHSGTTQQWKKLVWIHQFLASWS